MSNSKEKAENGSLIERWLLRFLEAGIEGDKRRLELAAVSAIRALRPAHPELARELGGLLGQLTGAAGGVARWHRAEAPPTDHDSSAALVKIEDPSGSAQPILALAEREVIERFKRERLEAPRLLAQGVLPPRTLLLSGPPGTGKTMLARWLAAELGLQLVTLDLATSISSYLGKTGLNLRRALDYARAMPCLLLLDEFDAVAKRRDDVTEVGELKRIVNVLLKELEEWPISSVLVAATNHPELLDPAVQRRFDRVLLTGVPGADERLLILKTSLGRYAESANSEFLGSVTELMGGYSGSDIHTFGCAVVRRHIIDSESIERASILELGTLTNGGKALQSKTKRRLIKDLHEASGKALNLTRIGEIFGLSPSSIHYHLSKEE